MTASLRVLFRVYLLQNNNCALVGGKARGAPGLWGEQWAIGDLIQRIHIDDYFYVDTGMIDAPWQFDAHSSDPTRPI